uniref:Uncharacterized protein n=1 Tax=Anguilla anguilla TaxID=7936 RepID=A0A0E9QR07_ANGAN
MLLAGEQFYVLIGYCPSVKQLHIFRPFFIYFFKSVFNPIFFQEFKPDLRALVQCSQGMRPPSSPLVYLVNCSECEAGWF